MKNPISIQGNAMPTTEEISLANFLIKNRFTTHVYFLEASKIHGVKTPDAEINGLKYEIKTPIGKSANTIKRAFKTASRQSINIIFDLRYSALPDQVNIQKLKKEFSDIKKVKHLVIITKSRKILEYSK